MMPLHYMRCWRTSVSNCRKRAAAKHSKTRAPDDLNCAHEGLDLAPRRVGLCGVAVVCGCPPRTAHRLCMIEPLAVQPLKSPSPISLSIAGALLSLHTIEGAMSGAIGSKSLR